MSIYVRLSTFWHLGNVERNLADYNMYNIITKGLMLLPGKKYCQSAYLEILFDLLIQ